MQRGEDSFYPVLSDTVQGLRLRLLEQGPQPSGARGRKLVEQRRLDAANQRFGQYLGKDPAHTRCVIGVGQHRHRPEAVSAREHADRARFHHSAVRPGSKDYALRRNTQIVDQNPAHLDPIDDAATVDIGRQIENPRLGLGRGVPEGGGRGDSRVELEISPAPALDLAENHERRTLRRRHRVAVVSCAARRYNRTHARGSVERAASNFRMTKADIARLAKELLIEGLRLEMNPDEIVDSEPIFGEGLGLDSIDALEFVVLVEERFGVSIPDETVAKQAFASIEALSDFIHASRSLKAV